MPGKVSDGDERGYHGRTDSRDPARQAASPVHGGTQSHPPRLDPVGVDDTGRLDPALARRGRVITFIQQAPWRPVTRERRTRQLVERTRQRPDVAAELRARGHGDRADDLAACRTRKVLVDPEKPAEARFTTSSCNDRACASCYERRLLQRLLALCPGIDRLLDDGAVASFVGLTIPRIPGSTPSVVRAGLQAAFARLRRTSLFKAAVRASIVKYEGHGTVTAGPHEHLHVLIVGNPLDPALLLKAWRRAVRIDCALVDLELVTRHEVRWVLIYMSKPLESEPKEIVDRALAFRGKHDVSIAGALAAVTSAPAARSNNSSAPARRAVALPPAELAALARAGVGWAQVALTALGRFAP